MKKLGIIILIIIVFINKTKGQEYSYTNSNNLPSEKSNTELNRHRPLSIYCEFGGNALILSLNADVNLKIYKNHKALLRGGYGYDYVPINIGHRNQTHKVTIVEIGYLFGCKHNFEAGYGLTNFLDHKSYPIRIGYRYVGKKGFLFRATPIYFINHIHTEWSFGASVGFAI